ncbi:MAG: hypothetical protein LEGION0403_FIIPPAGN_01892 [Legionella sp.]|uniref:hypothetical protein n=1 Tax=Legionella sp. TaxID=459 RepID=UPI003D0D808A
MPELCYIAIGGASASKFREINLETISENDLTSLILQEAEEHDAYSSQKGADEELHRSDTIAQPKNKEIQEININVKFTLHCSKGTFLQKKANFQNKIPESLPIDSKIDIKAMESKTFSFYMKQVINKELAQKEAEIIREHFGAGKKFNHPAFDKEYYNDLFIITQSTGEQNTPPDASNNPVEEMPSSYGRIMSQVPPNPSVFLSFNAPKKNETREPLNNNQEQLHQAQRSRTIAIVLIVLGVLTLPLLGIGLLPLVIGITSYIKTGKQIESLTHSAPPKEPVAEIENPIKRAPSLLTISDQVTKDETLESEIENEDFSNLKIK